MLGSYKQFCPVAMAAEILCTRWTVLVLREISLTRPIRVREGEFRGSLVPAGPGSIAIFGDTRSDLSEITARLGTAVEWIEPPGDGQ